MPLTPAYTWSETENSIRIVIKNVPIKDQSQIFCSDRVVKLNAPPYLLLLDLKDTIDDDRSTATVVKGRDVQLQLAKNRPGQWGSLTAIGEKKAIKQQRDESIKRAHEKQVAAQQERLARKHKEEKAAIEHQISVERAQRARLDSLKQQELQQEREQLQEWQQQLPNNQHHVGSGDESDYEDDLIAGTAGSADATEVSSSSSSSAAAAAGYQDAVADHPDYYGRGWQHSRKQAAAAADLDNIQVNGGACDSNHNRQDAANSITSLSASSDTHQSVMQSMAADAAAATSANRHAAVDSSNPDSSSNEQLMTVISSSNISNKQHVQQSQQEAAGVCAVIPARPQAPVRCQAAPVPVTFTQLQTPHLPAREQREVEIKSIKRQAKGDSVDVSDRQPAFLKDKGDGLAAQGNYRGAINAYTRAIELDPNQPSLWSNRAACHLAVGAAADCEADCTAAIQLLSVLHGRLLKAAGVPEEGQELLAGLLPPPTAAAILDHREAAGLKSEALIEDTLQDMNESTKQEPVESQQQQAAQLIHAEAATAGEGQAGGADSSAALVKLQQQLIKALSRRAAARVELQQLQEAADDLQQALRLDPGNPQLAADSLEVAAALNPAAAADPASLKQRGDARFKAGDMPGAVEAYTALAQQLEQQQKSKAQLAEQEQGSQRGSSKEQQQQHHQLMLAALSNRAACWLSLEKYETCVADCSAALHLALMENDATGNSTASGTAAVDVGEVVNTDTDSLATCQGANGAADMLSAVLQHQLVHPPHLLAAKGAACVKSVARLLGRAAVAHCCLKQLQPAEQLYQMAESCWQLLGDTQRAAALAADRLKLQKLSAESGGLDSGDCLAACRLPVI